MFKYLIFFIVILFCMTCSSTNTQDIAFQHFKKGNHYLKKRLFNTAIQEYRAALEFDNTQPVFYYNLGNAQYELQLYKHAIDTYKKVIELHPSFYEAWYNLSLAYNKINDLNNAQIAFQKYQKILNP